MNTFKLDPEMKKEWIARLRSGEYKQGFEKLRNFQNDFCCLGVLCDIVDSSKWFAPKYITQGYIWDFIYGYATVIPQDLLPEHIQYHLVQMNDGGKTFAAIADWIEENL